jgi:hypothetical protein
VAERIVPQVREPKASPFVREKRERMRRQREAFEAQMSEPKPVEVWPDQAPLAFYDGFVPSEPPVPPKKTLKAITLEVARKHRMPVKDILSSRRSRPIVAARHEVFWRCWKETALSLPQIGRLLGGKDHTTVLHGLRKHEERMKEAENA